MSTLWTPGGERPIRREPSAPGPAGGSGGDREGGGGDPAGSGGGREPTEEEVRAYYADLQERLAKAPAGDVIANHAYSFFELAALHLSLHPPQLDQARVAIDALGGVVDALGDRLGELHQTLSDALGQLRLTYLELHAAVQAGAVEDAGGGDGPGDPLGHPPGDAPGGA